MCETAAGAWGFFVGAAAVLLLFYRFCVTVGDGD